MIKILNIITGGISTDGITSAWLAICENWVKNPETTDLRMDFLCIDNISSRTVVRKFENLGFRILNVNERQSNVLTYYRDLSKILNREKYDIIHANGSSSFMILEMLAAKQNNIPIRLSHSRNTTCSRKSVHKLLQRPFNRLSNRRIACGKDAGEWLFGKYPFEVFHNGIDLGKFIFKHEIRDQIRSGLNLTENTVAIGHVGKFNYQKNHRFLIRAFERINDILPESRLFLFGDGPLTSEIKESVSAMKLDAKIEFMGAVDNISDYLQAMDVMLLPSRFEGLPNVVVEWQASGLPCIVSDSITRECASTNLVEFLPLKDSYDTWTKKTIEVCRNRESRELRSINATKKLRENGFDIIGQTNRLIALYKDAINHN